MQQQLLRAGRLLESAGPCSATQGCLFSAILHQSGEQSSLIVLGSSRRKGASHACSVEVQELSRKQSLALVGLATCN